MDTLELGEALRRETRELHSETEAVALRLVESDPGGYAVLLGELRALHLLAAKVFPRLDLRPRLILIERDISELELPPSQVSEMAELNLDSVARGLGLLYVIEGSNLVGSLLARRVRALWKVVGRGTPPLHYLSSDGLDVGARWRTFSSELSAFAQAHPESGPEVIEGARQAFMAFKGRLELAWPPLASATFS